MVFATRGCDARLAGSTLIFATPLRVRCNRFEIKLITFSMLEPGGVCCKSSARIAARGA